MVEVPVVSVTVDLDPELTGLVQRDAALLGVGIDAYILGLVEKRFAEDGLLSRSENATSVSPAPPTESEAGSTKSVRRPNVFQALVKAGDRGRVIAGKLRDELQGRSDTDNKLNGKFVRVEPIDARLLHIVRKEKIEGPSPAVPDWFAVVAQELLDEESAD